MAEDRSQGRRFPRIPARNALLVKRLGDEAVEGFAPASSMSLGGCSFTSGEALGVGSVLELSIAVDREVVRVTARVVHERPVEGGRHEVGAEFLDLADADNRVLETLLGTGSAG